MVENKKKWDKKRKLSWCSLKLVDKSFVRNECFFRCPSSNKSHYVSAWNERGGFAHTQTYTWGRGNTNSVREEFIELSCSFDHWKWDRWLQTDTLMLQVTEKQNSCESECVYWSICCQSLFKLFLRVSLLRNFWHYNRMILFVYYFPSLLCGMFYITTTKKDLKWNVFEI